ncbi:MAG: hypothetical protein J7M18_00565 [Candidatus Eremiobacteraeota bacterium]|nr:hypothetical protein [Candidatus Eremiobacteraeota bacterium]
MTGLDLEIKRLSAEAKDNPEEAETWYSLGKAAMLRGLNFTALMAFEKSRELKPAHPFSQLGIASVLANVGMNREALDALGKFTLLSPYDLRGYLLFRRLQSIITVPESMKDIFSYYEDVKPWKVRLSTTLEEIRQEEETLKRFMKDVRSIPEEENVLLRSHLAIKKAEERLSALKEDEKILKSLEKVATDEEEPEIEPPTAEHPAEVLDDEIRKHLEELLSPILSIRGIVYSGIYDFSGKLFVKVSSEKIPLEVLSDIVVGGVESIDKFGASGKFVFWGMEFEEGLLVFERLGENHVLLLLGKKGASFGAIRFHMKRARDAILEAIPGEK